MQIFATLDAASQPVELAGFSAWLFWQQDEAGLLQRADRQVIVADLANWDAAALALNGVQSVDVPEPPPGEVRTGYALSVVSDGVISVQATFEPAPAPPRREISKLTVQARLKALGKLGDAWTALQADADKFGLWVMDGPNVFADDANLLALLQGIGLTADQIAEVTA